MSPADLEHKIRLLTLASLGFKHVGQNLPYSTIAEALDVDAADVEKWVIDGTYRSATPTYPTLTTSSSHPCRPRPRQALSDDEDAAHCARNGTLLRARAVGGFGEAARGLEDRLGGRHGGYRERQAAGRRCARAGSGRGCVNGGLKGSIY